MYQSIHQLYQISNKPQRIILGLMSGTSLDGLDIALCEIAGNGLNTKVKLLNFKTVLYKENFKKEVQEIFCKQQVSLEKICFLNAYIGTYYSQIISETLQEWNVKNEDVDLIASHGQTIYHSPKTEYQQAFYNSTLQIGDADHIAFNTNIITISDFRQKHIAAGGQGAPLAIYGDYFLLSSKDENRILLNIGGIANFTFLPKNKNIDEILCTDTGSGNTLMDVYIQHYFHNKFYDDNASVALQGIVNKDLLNALWLHEFFNQSFPKSTGQEVFNLQFINDAMMASNTMQLSISDVMATLNYFTAVTIVDAINNTIVEKEYTIYVSGGGLNNPLLMQNLQQLLPQHKIQSTEILGINPNAKEAILFALLANETVCGNIVGQATNSGKAIKNGNNMLSITMGKISLPR